MDEQTQQQLEGLLLEMEGEYKTVLALQGAEYGQRADYHFCKVAPIEQRVRRVMADLKKKLIDEDMAMPPSMRANYYALLAHPFNSLMRLDRAQLLHVSLEGCDVELKPSEAVF